LQNLERISGKLKPGPGFLKFSNCLFCRILHNTLLFFQKNYAALIFRKFNIDYLLYYSISQKGKSVNQMIVPPNINKLALTHEVVIKVEQVEELEKSECAIEFQIINTNIWMLNITHRSRDGKSVFFQSLNLYQKGTSDLVFSMQDGKMYGFEISSMTGHYHNTLQTPEDFVSEILYDLFVHGWD
jgi:hypothetical protein